MGFSILSKLSNLLTYGDMKCIPLCQLLFFSLCQNNWQRQLGEESFALVHSLRLQFIVAGGHGDGILRHLVTWQQQSGNKERRMLMLTQLTFFCLFWAEPHPGVRVRSSHLSQPSRELLHRHAQSSVSLVILEPAKLTINTNDRVIVVIFISIVSISDLTFLLDFTGLNVFSW